MCSHCKKEFEESNFNWKIKNVRRSPQCKNCSRQYLRSHYQRNTRYYLNKAQRRNLYVKNQFHLYIAKHLLSHPCVDCGEKDISVLEFDHTDKNTKINDISTMIRKGMSFNKIVAEVEKCEVRCSNCHSKKTAIETNSWKLKYAPVAQLD